MRKSMRLTTLKRVAKTAFRWVVVPDVDKNIDFPLTLWKNCANNPGRISSARRNR